MCLYSKFNTSYSLLNNPLPSSDKLYTEVLKFTKYFFQPCKSDSTLRSFAIS